MTPRLLVALLLWLLVVAPASTAMAQKQLLIGQSEEGFLVKNSGLVWQYQRSAKIRNFMNMQNYISSSETEGWRLPTKQELYDLVEIFDLHQNGTVKIDYEGSYWLTDDSGNIVTGAWEIGDQCGPSRTYYPHKRGHIRLVRTQ
jgi:hypothetical protein